MATSVEEETVAEMTTPPLEKITAFHTEPSHPSSLADRYDNHRGDSRDHRDSTDDVNDKHGGTVRMQGFYA